MIPPRTWLRFGPATLAVVLTIVALVTVPEPPIQGLARETASADKLPASLTDREFWALSEKISEPDGYFRSNSGSTDNLLSNENMVSTVAGALAQRVKPSGVYLGVGPEQNFTYIAAIRPRIAFITDIRRGNLHLHLLYKALFETSADRADFVGRLFSRSRPAGLTVRSTASEILNAYLQAAPLSEAGYQANLKTVRDLLTKTRAIPLGTDDLNGIDYVYRNFYKYGPAINYTSSINGRAGSAGSYAMIVSAIDLSTRTERTFLASEENFGIVKALENRNLIVPIVGDFAGPKALRAVGTYLKEHDAIVTAFYVSNVEMYLERNGVWSTFCANVAALPLDAESTFIRPSSGQSRAFGAMKPETASCAR
jgi:hypothetical protein